MSDEHLGLCSSLNEISSECNFEKPVLDLAVSNDTLAMNTTNFHNCFCIIFAILKLPQHFITLQICIFISSILGAYDHRLNYDAQSFTIKVKMTNENTC